MQIIFSRDLRKNISTNIYVAPDQWDSKNEKIINHPGASLLNKQLYEKKQLFQAMELNAMETNTPFTIEYLNQLLKPAKGIQKNTIDQDPIFADYMLKSLCQQKQLKTSSFEDQLKTQNRFKRYFPKLRFSEITYTTLAEFNRLCLEEHIAKSTIGKHHKNIKKYINLAYKEGVYAYPPGRHPYANFKVPRIKGNRAFLTTEELALLEAGALPPHLEDYRQMFLFICYTGLRISDFMRLDSSMIRGDLLHLVPIKTEDSSSAEVHLPLKDLFGGKPFRIWERYNFEFPNKMAGFDCRLNAALKQIALILGLQKHLTCHVGRHTFLTHIAMKTGNVFAVMNLGGLKKVDTAMVYIHLSEQDNRKLLSKVQW
ncbi:MAG: site-specific integrase [Bacteroidales bacterium]|nr:site-specific integrase [Bacteroidales bacterium]